jgi:hypothetical protein
MLSHVIRSSVPRSAGHLSRSLSSSSSSRPWIVFSGSSLLQRLTSFFVGLGVGGGATMYLVRKELQDSNKLIAREIEGIKARVEKLERKN